MHGKQIYFKDGLRRRKYTHLEDVDTQWTVHVRATNTHLRILVSALSTQIKNLRTSGSYIHVTVGGFLLHVRATKEVDSGFIACASNLCPFS